MPHGGEIGTKGAAAKIVERGSARFRRDSQDGWFQRGEHPVRAIRKFRGLTQSNVADRAGLRQGYIADIEAARKTGSAASLKAIAAALGVPLDVLVG